MAKDNTPAAAEEPLSFEDAVKARIALLLEAGTPLAAAKMLAENAEKAEREEIARLASAPKKGGK